MSAGEPTEAPEAGTPAELGTETAGGAEAWSLALPIAADPVLAGLAATFHASHVSNGADLGQAEMHAYEGHVALELDTSLLPAIDGMLDLLTSSHDLFDVPAVDIASASASDDASST
jgi:hypothetical protein